MKPHKHGFSALHVPRRTLPYLLALVYNWCTGSCLTEARKRSVLRSWCAWEENDLTDADSMALGRWSITVIGSRKLRGISTRFDQRSSPRACSPTNRPISSTVGLAQPWVEVEVHANFGLTSSSD
jgi:hypothetical protein